MKLDTLNITCSITEESLGIHQWPEGRIGGRLDTKAENQSPQEDRCDSYTGIGHPFVATTDQKDRWWHSSQEKKRTGSLGDGPPRITEGIELVIPGDSKTVVDWINGKAKQKVSYRAIATIQIQLMEWWKKGVDLSQRIGDWAVRIFREHNSTPHTSHFIVDPFLMARTCVAQGSSRMFGVRSAHFTSSHASSPCAHVVCLIFRDFSTFLSLLSIFSPIVLFFLLAIIFFSHDAVDKFSVHFG